MTTKSTNVQPLPGGLRLITLTPQETEINSIVIDWPGALGLIEQIQSAHAALTARQRTAFEDLRELEDGPENDERTKC